MGVEFDIELTPMLFEVAMVLFMGAVRARVNKLTYWSANLNHKGPGLRQLDNYSFWLKIVLYPIEKVAYVKVARARLGHHWRKQKLAQVQFGPKQRWRKMVLSWRKINIAWRKITNSWRKIKLC